MSFSFSDPLVLLSAQTGLTIEQLREQQGEGNQKLQSRLESIQVGDPIPIVFCRRRTVGSNTHGGVYIAPKASEGSFANDSVTNELTFAYLLVLSDGELPLVQIRDIYQRTCRVGDTFNQVFDGRAGTWTPGNSITAVAGTELWRAPVFVGTGGSYDNITTLSFEGTAANGDDSWSNQIFVYVRQGIQVTRLVDSVTGPSDNFADLANYLLSQTSRVGSDLIDTAQMTLAANFTDTNGFFFNGNVTESQNLQDWLEKTSYDFLLRSTRTNGKFGLRPRLPYNADNTIKTTAITPEFTFTEEHILPDGFEIEYISAEDRQPACVVVLWRQQPEADFGLVRSIEIRYSGEAPNGPFIQRDMSNYCTTENHAIKVGVYSLACREYITHHLRIKVRERSYNSTLTVGDIVRVRLRRETSEGELTHHDYLYEIERVTKSPEAFLEFDLTHFPIDSEGRSIVAKAVAAASGQGNNITAGRGTFDCDVNDGSSTATVGTDSSVPGNAPAAGDTTLDIDRDPDVPNPINEPPSPAPISNPADPLDQSLDESALRVNGNPTTGNTYAKVGDTLSIREEDWACTNARICWYRIDKNSGERYNISCVTGAIGGNYSYQVTTTDVDYWLAGFGQCPDPSDPSGYGPETFLGQLDNLVEPNFEQYTYARWKGLYFQYGQEPTPYWQAFDGYYVEASRWRAFGSGFLTLGGFYIAGGPGWVDSEPNGYLVASYGDGSDTPWRSVIWAKKNTPLGTGFSSASYYIGAMGINIGSPPVSWQPDVAASARPFTYIPQGAIISALVGSWQFSNDESTIELEWIGRNYMPSGFTTTDTAFQNAVPWTPR